MPPLLSPKRVVCCCRRRRRLLSSCPLSLWSPVSRRGLYSDDGGCLFYEAATKRTTQSKHIGLFFFRALRACARLIRRFVRKKEKECCCSMMMRFFSSFKKRSSGRRINRFLRHTEEKKKHKKKKRACFCVGFVRGVFSFFIKLVCGPQMGSTKKKPRKKKRGRR